MYTLLGGSLVVHFVHQYRFKGMTMEKGLVSYSTYKVDIQLTMQTNEIGLL